MSCLLGRVCPLPQCSLERASVALYLPGNLPARVASLCLARVGLARVVTTRLFQLQP